MGFYKGYITTKNKAATMKFKNAKLKKLKDVENEPEYAGVLADDTILVDVDDPEQSELLLDIIEEQGVICKVHKTTRGMHFLFKINEPHKCMTNVILSCGISHVDIKCGTAYEVLKFDGKDRTVLYDRLDGEAYDTLPEWMTPIQLKKKVDFNSMCEGDGRNDELFQYVSRLQEQGLSDEAIKISCSIINNHIFKTPLPQEELEIILREERFSQPVFYVKGVFQFDVFAKYLAKENNMVLIDNDLYTFNGEVYTNDQRIIEKQMISIIPKLSHSMRSEILYYLQLVVTDHEQTDYNLVAFQNGVYDIKRKELFAFDPCHIVTNQLNTYFDENAYDRYVDEVLDNLTQHDEKLRLLLEQSIGYCFYRRNEIRKAFVLIGGKQNGKSTFLTMLQELVGHKNYCALDLNELNDRFKPAQLCNKLVNIGDDIEDDFIPNAAIFKKLVTGNPINVERKGQDPFDFRNYAKFIFSANEMPKIKDKTGAVISRLIMIPFNAVFKPGTKGYDPEIIDKLTTPNALSYLANLGLKALDKLLEDKEFVEVTDVDEMVKKYEIENNPILQFLDETDILEIANEDTREIYLRYSTFCNENGYKAVSKILFSKTICREAELTTKTKSINGRSVRIFVRK